MEDDVVVTVDTGSNVSNIDCSSPAAAAASSDEDATVDVWHGR